MSKFVRTMSLGQAKISIINIGDIYLPLAKYMNVPESEWATFGLDTQQNIPIQFTLIQLPQATVLVDAGVYDVESEPVYAIEGYKPPMGLVDRLAELGVQPNDVDHVIITHRHWDHFNGTVIELDGQLTPTFPNARYYLGQVDWERAEEALQDPESIESRTLAVLHQHGKLELVGEKMDVVEAIKVIPAPGETRGHQIIRIHSEGETFYCLGDLYHHPVEFQNKAWMVSWARPETTLSSRQALLESVFEENAYLMATHIPGIGQLEKDYSGVKWNQV